VITKKQARALLVGAGIILLLAVIALVAPLVLPAASAQVVKFLAVFLAILMTFIFFGVYLAAVLFSGRVGKRTYAVIEGVVIAGIVLGALGMFQPWFQVFYALGFQVLLVSTLAFTVWSHVAPRAT
jgi:hypothetical protein